MQNTQKADLLCIGHRGAMGHEPENTLASVAKALALGVPWIEIDLYYVDGQLMVFHDDRLEPNTNGSGYIQQQSFAYLRSLRVRGSDQLIPTLAEVCELINGRVGLNIELKGAGTAKPVSDLLERLITEGWARDKFLISSFNHRELQAFKAINPDLRIGVLHCSLPVDDAKFAAELEAYSVNPSLEFVDQRYVDDAHRRGLKVYVYTVNHPEDIVRMRDLGVDGVFTNYPERVLG